MYTFSLLYGRFTLHCKWQTDCDTHAPKAFGDVMRTNRQRTITYQCHCIRYANKRRETSDINPLFFCLLFRWLSILLYPNQSHIGSVCVRAFVVVLILSVRTELCDCCNSRLLALKCVALKCEHMFWYVYPFRCRRRLLCRRWQFSIHKSNNTVLMKYDNKYTFCVYVFVCPRNHYSNCGCLPTICAFSLSLASYARFNSHALL